MKRTLFTGLMLSAGMALTAPLAFASTSGCSSKTVMAEQEAQSANISTPISAPTSDVVTTVSAPIVKEAQSSYGSGTPAPTTNQAVVERPMVKTAMVEKTAVHADFTNILQKYVSAPDGQGLTHFNYGGLKANSADKAALDSYIKKLEGINPDNLPTNQAIAYYANLYNAVTVQVVTDNYPLKSIRKLGSFNSGPWKKNLFTINGAPSNLNAVEHEILRKKFPSPYVHYMVNCASVGCPNLLQGAWEADSLGRIRVQAARDYINSPRGVQITPNGLKVSSIFKWFKEDFGSSEQNILRHIREHANPALAAAIDNGVGIDGYDYDWSVND